MRLARLDDVDNELNGLAMERERSDRMKTHHTVRAASVARARLSSAFDRLARWRAVCVASAMCATVAGCGGNREDVRPAPTETKTSTLLSSQWKGSFGVLPFHGNISTDPAVCSNRRGYFFAVGRDDADQKYYVNVATHPFVGTTWTAFGMKQFSSAPTCAFEKPYRYAHPPTTAEMKFVLAGKGSDNRLYAVPGHQVLSGYPPPNPTWDSAWAELKAPSETAPTYSGNYGRPALASTGSVIVVTFLAVVNVNGTNETHIQARTRATPYASNSWSAIKDGPKLPTGVTADGVPAIAYDRGPASAAINKFVVMIRGISSGTAHLYWVYFDGNNWGSWTQAAVFNPVLSDPALEYDDQTDALTLYFKDYQGVDGQGAPEATIVSASVPSADWFGYHAEEVVGTELSGSLSAPRAVFGGSYETGIRMVMSRGYPKGAPSSSQILWVEDLHMSPFSPYNNMPSAGPACFGTLFNDDGFGGSDPSIDPTVVGCAGQVTWELRGDLCGPGSRPCTAAEFVAARGSAVPTHNYWTDDNLRYSGTFTDNCAVSTTSGSFCPSNQPMHVCTATGSDAEGNSCNWHNCGFGTNSPNQYFGGCAYDLTAGTLCCLSVP
jgi:hypothetical protein